MPEKKIGIYPGTFDPITNGHVDIIKRALHVVDDLIVAVADDIPKKPLFNLKEREKMIQEVVNDLGKKDRVKVISFKGLLVDFAKKNKARILIRGLRAVSDFEYEFQLASMNNKLMPGIETIFLPASENVQFIASSFVKEIARLGGDVSSFVPTHVAKKLKR